MAEATSARTDPYEVAAVRKLGVIDLPTIQKKANLHFSLTLDRDRLPGRRAG